MRTRAATAMSAPSVRILGIGDQLARTFYQHHHINLCLFPAMQHSWLLVFSSNLHVFKIVGEWGYFVFTKYISDAELLKCWPNSDWRWTELETPSSLNCFGELFNNGIKIAQDNCTTNVSRIAYGILRFKYFFPKEVRSNFPLEIYPFSIILRKSG